MTTGDMIRELRRLEEVHRDDFVGTGETNWASMCHDVANRLEELLAAQTPRVMTLDELSEKTDVYFESLVYDTICPALSAGSYDDGTVGLMTLEDELFYMDEADYGVQWRCWTDRPDEATRRATPWE